MAVTLRLARHGQKKRPFYRIVAAEKTQKRDGRFLEIVGIYNPMIEPPSLTIKEERVMHWIDNGAEATSVVKSLISKKLPGYIEGKKEKQRAKIQAKRKARKEKVKAS